MWSKLSQPYKSNLRNRYSSPLFVRLYLLFVRTFNRGFACLTTNAALLRFSFDHLTLLRVSAVKICLENFYLWKGKRRCNKITIWKDLEDSIRWKLHAVVLQICTYILRWKENWGSFLYLTKLKERRGNKLARCNRNRFHVEQSRYVNVENVITVM